MQHMEKGSRLAQGECPCPDSRPEFPAAPWELVMDKQHFKLWRRPIEGTHLYQYRVFGSYTDVTPRQFFNVQLDTEYRKKWDNLVIKLDVIERDLATGSEVIHWVTHFPYPMYSRDYVYVRRYSVDKENNLMVLVSRAVEHPGVPEDPEYVRVRTYESQMVIRPHKTFDENGFDYLLTYSDNPQTVFPRYCVSWMVSSGMPDFLEKLHAAALKAKKLELEVRDYMAPKGPESSEGGGKANSRFLLRLGTVFRTVRRSEMFLLTRTLGTLLGGSGTREGLEWALVKVGGSGGVTEGPTWASHLARSWAPEFNQVSSTWT
ncbi:PREDICTED: stAR-related lipid transfer protein 7, mitochondrial [Chaetura pelagica]|uniref:stAR-related lipid transfer protein 7, mitochondrial n=1 Tax=Chaetura pelagica TaxID=8897 RepID=UPI0005237CEC|nr:PREDICTED: stAR-related lipid transfer protein 7, mitochondrial [Chaetura pelagica]